MRTPFLFLVLLTGCPNPDGKDDTAGNTDDTGDTDPNYETGCITIDGGGGYAKIADAVTLAPEGAVIELCDGSYEEAVTIDKAVTIRGASVDGTLLSGGGVEIPLTITGTGVVIENLVLSSARTAVALENGAEATLNAITVAEAGSWGISSSDATLTISGLSIVEPGEGGIEVSGGTAMIDGASIEYPGGYGIDVSGQADVTVSNSTITGTVMLSDDVSDGFAFQVDGATLTTSAVTVAGADGMGIFATDANLNLADTTFQDAVYLGIYATSSTFDLSGVSIAGTLLQGIYATGDSFTMADSTVSADSETSCSYLYEEWGVDYGPWCGGMYLVTDAAELTNVNVSGWNNYGWLVAPNTAESTALTVSGGTIDDVGRWGAYVYTATGTIDGLTVSNNRDPEVTDELCYYVDRSVALLGIYSDVQVTGLNATNNVGWGFVSLAGTATVDGSTFDGNGCSAFANYEAQATITGSTFTNGSDWGSVYDQSGVLVVDGNTFVDNSTDGYYYYSYEGKDHYGAYVYTYETTGGAGSGQDVVSYTSGLVSVTNNTFSGGDQGVYVSSASEVEVTGNTWTDYEGAVFTAYMVTNPVVFTNNTADDVVGPVVQASLSEVEVEGLQVGTTRAAATETVTYGYDYQDDAYDWTSSYTSSSSSYVFYTYGSYSDDGSSVTEYPAALRLSDVSVDSAYSTLLYAYNATVDISGMSAAAVGGNFLYGYWDYFSPDVEIEGLTLGPVTSGAFYLSNASTSYGSVALTDVDVESTAGDGVYAAAIGQLDLSDVSFGTVSGDGVQAISRSYDFVYEYDPDTGSYDYYYVDLDADTELNVSQLSITSATGSGLSLQGGSATIDGLRVDAIGSYGVYTEGLTALSVANTTLTAPGITGVDVTDNYTYYSYETYESLSDDGDTVTTLTGVTITDAGSAAIAIDGGTATLSGVSATASGTSGLVLLNTTANVEGNTFTGNDEYGMACEDGTVTLATCSGNDLSDNAMGTHLDCSDTCEQ